MRESERAGVSERLLAAPRTLSILVRKESKFFATEPAAQPRSDHSVQKTVRSAGALN
jgi:hypothetical protein